MKDVRAIIQKKLDEVLLEFGITSHHLRKVESVGIQDSNISINENEYVVYRIVSSKSLYGDGKQTISKKYIDLNFYYKYSKNSTDLNEPLNHFKTMRNAFINDSRFILSSEESDIVDYDNPYRGINIEFCYLDNNG